MPGEPSPIGTGGLYPLTRSLAMLVTGHVDPRYSARSLPYAERQALLAELPLNGHLDGTPGGAGLIVALCTGKRCWRSPDVRGQTGRMTSERCA